MLKYVQVFVNNKLNNGLNENKEVSFSKNSWTLNSVCLYRCTKEGKFMLCVPKMQIALVPITGKRKIKFNVVDPFIRVLVFFLFVLFWLSSSLHLHPVLHPVTYCYIRSAVVLLGLPVYSCQFIQHSSPISTMPISDSILAKDITLDRSKA